MPRLYPRNNDAVLDSRLFCNPTSEYRGAPFWSWNNRLDQKQLCQQIEFMKTMGMGGFHMHSRTGMATPYLGADFMSCVTTCIEKAKSEKMLAWLYDEDRWPSGFAGGIVTQNPQYRQKHLRCTFQAPGSQDAGETGPREDILLARYRIRLNANGCLMQSERLADTAPEEAGLWYVFQVTAPCSSWYNKQSYVDVLSPEAIAEFITATHERYYQACGQDFGSTIPAIFTDEPQTSFMTRLLDPFAKNDCILSWTHDFATTYAQRWNEDLLNLLPELIWDLPEGRRSVVRWRFFDHLAERFASAYHDQISVWCTQHGIAYTGHLLCEQELLNQTYFAGEAMRHYRAFQIPGIDMLCDGFEFITAKQAVSVARQDAREGVISELYGVTNWNFRFQGHKRQGDWQAALGVTVRCHHLYWVSMEGNAKRDCPASIGHQSPWFGEYRLVEDHFSRLHTALVRGRPIVRISVIHPVESMWLSIGPETSTAAQIASQEKSFQDLARWLLDACLDFDYICESLFVNQCPSPKEQALLHVGAMAYDAVIVSNLITIRSSTLERLQAFAAAGGRVIFSGRIPDHVDGLPSLVPAAFAQRCQIVALDRGSVVQSLADLSLVQVLDPSGKMIDDVVHQIRQDGERRWVFLCCHQAQTPQHFPWDNQERTSLVRIRGLWQATLYDTITGSMQTIAHHHANDWTEIAWDRTPGSHLLLALDPAKVICTHALAPLRKWEEYSRMPDPVRVTLHEPNVLLFDQGEYRLEQGPWQAIQEIQRAEKQLRAMCGWSQKSEHIAQPWCITPSGEYRTITWRFSFEVAVAIAGASLAMEKLSSAKVRLDGQSLAVVDTGWWTDECIRTMDVPRLSSGKHALEIDLPMTPEGSLECLYLLGNFGVELRGRHTRLLGPVQELAWGDWTHQGLPFYAGNLTYHTHITGEDQAISLHIPWFANPLLTVDLDGKRLGPIAFNPYRLDLGVITKGQHRLDITCYGNRANTFGAVHNSDPSWHWWASQAWETTGDSWCDEYRLWPQGITSAPRLERPL